MLQIKTLRTVIPMALAVFALLAYNFMAADWSVAPSNPPSNNVPPPINISPNYQSKSGSLGALTIRSGGYCNALGTSCLWLSGNANQFVLTLPDGDQMDGGIEVNNNVISFIGDRNNDGGWNDWQNRWPLQLHLAATPDAEYAQFSNQVRANSYCDLNGENCLSSTAGSVYNTQTQYFEVYGGAGVSDKTENLGSWSVCHLARQKTSADDNNMQDGCWVKETTAGSGVWELKLSKAGEDSLTCGAYCMHFGPR